MDLNLTNKPTAITELANFYIARKTRPNPVVHVIGVEKHKRDTCKLLLTDGLYSHEAFVECTLMRSKQLQKGSVVRLAQYLRAIVDDTTVIKVLDLNVIGVKCDIIGDPKPFPYRATTSVEDYCRRDSLPEDKHSLLKGSCILVEDYCRHGSFPEDEHPLLNGSCIYAEDYCRHNSLPEDEHPLLKGSCISVEDYSRHDSLPEDEDPLLKGSRMSADDCCHGNEHSLFKCPFLTLDY